MPSRPPTAQPEPAAWSLPPWAAADAECQVLARLRQTPQLFADLQAATGTEFHIQKLLRQRYPDDLVRAALTMADLRRRASVKFARAAEMWFDRQGLEQATSEAVARHKAQRFSGQTWDLCCGIGGDAIALAARGPVVAVDLKPAAGLRTLWNAELHGVAANLAIECRDVTDIDVGQDLVHLDPDRRPGAQGRVLRIEDYLPGLDFLQQITQRARGGAIKLSPASNFGGKFANVETELISLDGECKEATIWFGELAGSAPFRATVLPAGETLAGHPLDALAERSALGGWIFDPDPAVVRAGLVDLLAEHLGLRRLDDAEEYLTGDRRVDSPFVQTFEVIELLPNHEKEIRQAVRRHNLGPLEIKCRHIPVSAEALRRRLPRGDGPPGVLFFARELGKAHAILARRPAGNDEAQG